MSIKRSLDRVCSFTFADGRRCRTPRCSKHPYLCYFHAKKEAEALSLQEIGFDIGTWLTGNYVSACDLSAALGRVFSNTAQGKIKPRTASTLAYLGQTIALLGPRAQHEYINAFGTEAWRAQIRSSGELEPGPALRPPPSFTTPIGRHSRSTICCRTFQIVTGRIPPAPAPDGDAGRFLDPDSACFASAKYLN